MKKIKLLVEAIKGNIKYQIATGALAVAVGGGAIYGGVVAYNNHQEKLALEKIDIEKKSKLQVELDSYEDKYREKFDKIKLLIQSEEVLSISNDISKMGEYIANKDLDNVIKINDEIDEKINKVVEVQKSEIEKRLEELKCINLDDYSDEIKKMIEEKINAIIELIDKNNFIEADKNITEVSKITEENNNNKDEISDDEGSIGSSNNSSSSNNSGISNNSNSSNNGGSSNNSSSSNNGGSSNNSSSSNNSGSSNNSSSSNNSGSSNNSSSSNNGGSSNEVVSEPTTPSYEAFNGFSYNGGYKTGYFGQYADFASMYSTLSSKSTVSSFIPEVNKAVQELSLGADDNIVKSIFMNKLYNDKYLITNVIIERYEVDLIQNGQLITDFYPSLIQKGVENTPNGLFTTVLGEYGTTNDNTMSFVKCTVQFKEK